MKIRVNNIEYFRKLDDLIPTIEDIRKFFLSQDNETVNNILINVFGEDLLPIFIDYISKSKNKKLSSLVLSLFDYYGFQSTEEHYTLNQFGIKQLNQIIKYRFSNKWQKLVDTINLEYNPIKPYDMTIVDTKEDTMDADTSTQSTTTNTRENTEENSATSNNNNDIYGFNSSNAVPSDKSNNTSNDTTTTTGTDTNERNIDIEYDRTNNVTRNITRNGNIGNTTQQELIKQERQILEYQFMDTVFNDLDSVFTRSKYI